MRLLTEMGYSDVKDYEEGIQEWIDRGNTVDTSGQVSSSLQGNSFVPKTHGRRERLVEILVHNRSVAQLLGLWVFLGSAMGLLYWCGDLFKMDWLRFTAESGSEGNLARLGDCLYFSFVSILSIGYGDVVPHGAGRVFALFEGAAGLFVFGLIVSKIVSARQDQLIAETHSISFEERLGRVRGNLHLVLSELQEITVLCTNKVPG